MGASARARSEAQTIPEQTRDRTDVVQHGCGVRVET